jgi:hypothetical protein
MNETTAVSDSVAKKMGSSPSLRPASESDSKRLRAGY